MGYINKLAAIGRNPNVDLKIVSLEKF